MHASTAPRIAPCNHFSRLIAPGQRIRLGVLVRRELVPRESESWSLVYIKVAVKVALAANSNPVNERNNCSDEQRHGLPSLSHLSVCASRGDRDRSLTSTLYSARARVQYRILYEAYYTPHTRRRFLGRI